MKTILVPTDYSKAADNACRYAIYMAKEINAKIILMHVFETALLYTDAPMMTMQLDYSMIYESQLKELRKYSDKLNKLGTGVKIELVLQQGLPSSRINEIALEKKADLIVMGSTGKGMLERMLIGSNTLRIIKNAPCLVLAIPPKAKYAGLKKITYATDLLSDNLDHTKGVIPFAKTFNSEILFMNINTQLLSSNEEEDVKKIASKIKNKIRYPKSSGYICNDVNVVEGINYFIKKHQPDCLVMYTHHRNFINGILKPSITKSMVTRIKIPLLVIHENDYANDI